MEEFLAASKKAQMPSPAMQHGKNANLGVGEHVEDAVGKDREIDPADPCEALREMRWTSTQPPIRRQKFRAQAHAESRLLLLVPIEGLLQVNPDERMALWNGHRQTRQTSSSRRIPQRARASPDVARSP